MGRVWVYGILAISFNLITIEAFAANQKCKDLTSRITSRRWVTQRQQEIREALANNPSLALAYSNIQRAGYPAATLNPDILRDHSNSYTHEIPVRRIEDQEKSGRCWIFRCNRIVEIMNRDRVALSAVYPYFWHLFLQSDRYLMDIADLKPNKKSGVYDFIPDPAVEDGGWDEQYFSITRFIGMVPKHLMPEVAASLNTSDVTRQLNNYLARIANEILKRKLELLASGAGPKTIAKEMRSLRERGLHQIYQIILVKNLGEPPLKISLRRLVSEVAEGGLVKSRYVSVSTNPREYMKKALKFNPDDWIFLARHPLREANRVYQEISSDDYPTHPADPEGIRPPRILNLSIDDLLLAVESSIKKGVPVGFSGDMDHDIDHATGIMRPGIRRNFTDLPSAEAFRDLTVAEAMAFGVGDANHAMVISGIDKPTRGSAIKYKVVNSWGEGAGDNGFYHMYRSWAELHLYSVMVPKYVLPKRLRALLSQKSVMLDENFWNREPHETQDD